MKKTVVFDFDGVIHSYTSGWKGVDAIPDPPVPGIKEAIDQIRKEYNVIIVSTRCGREEGMAAVNEWLKKYGIEVDGLRKEKPPAVCYVDDRAICFDGDAETLINKIARFVPWYKKEEGKHE